MLTFPTTPHVSDGCAEYVMILNLSNYETIKVKVIKKDNFEPKH